MKNDSKCVINEFVSQFIGVIDEAASAVHQITLKLRPPSVTCTPYGGRLEWILPGKTKLFLHLKDKQMIRHRKRWSQVMYMYYLLGHRLMELPIHVGRKAVRAENTFILALDGDIVFEPHAVRLLVDLMRKNLTLGAVCGRVHPLGSGPIVWYQKFEYAISHWLQKASEHVFGCVLCSPGCFSLFRSRALMSDNVLRKYATIASEPLHFLQYDQGEDRWLSTLLLQGGYRIEYNAASDAYTYCPEGFVEFFNQRRRWGPSTLANNVDLLRDYKNLIEVNADVSFPYIIYQCVLMIGTILSPGAILLMIVGAVNAVFEVPTNYALVYNLIPVALFIAICFTTENETQLYVAQIFSACYAFLMMAVLIGTAIQFTQQLLSPSTVFFVVLILAFTITALLHPLEFSCLFPLPLYILCIPSMYMFLFIYSLININIASWGTREIAGNGARKHNSDEDMLDRGASRIRRLFPRSSSLRKGMGRVTFRLANLFTCLFCTDEKPSEEQLLLLDLRDSVKELNCRIHSLLDSAYQEPVESSPSSCAEYGQINSRNSERGLINEKVCSGPKCMAAESKSTDWIETLPFEAPKLCSLKEDEDRFWRDLIKKYLYPIEVGGPEENRSAYGLTDLRNRVVFSIFMLNGIFILTIFLLQMHKEVLAIRLPPGLNWHTRTETRVADQTDEAGANSIEPVASSFIILFGVILILQVIGMLIHRFTTFTHIIAFLKLNCFGKSDVDENLFKQNSVQIVKDMQSLKGIDEDGIVHSPQEHRRLERQNTVFNLERRKTQRQKTLMLDAAFRKRLSSMRCTPSNGVPTGNQVLANSERRRDFPINTKEKPGSRSVSLVEHSRRELHLPSLVQEDPDEGASRQKGIVSPAFIAESSDSEEK